MIRIFNQHEQEIKTNQGNFPDGTQLIRVSQDALKEDYLTIRWDYENEGELATLIFITRHLQENSDAKLILEMPYIPNARMDRVNNPDEIFRPNDQRPSLLRSTRT